MPEIGTPGLMSGDGKRGVGHRPQATAPILDSTTTDLEREASGMAIRIRARLSATSWADEQHRSQLRAERLRGLQADHQLEVARPPQARPSLGSTFPTRLKTPKTQLRELGPEAFNDTPLGRRQSCAVGPEVRILC